MMHHDFPMFRLATLLARQLSSPIATRIKEHVRTHPLFTRDLCMRTARCFRAVEMRFKFWSLRMRQPATLPPISDREAVDVGADLLGEIILFAIGAAIITFEFNRQAMNKEASRLERKSRWVAIGVALEELQRELVLQQQEIDAMLETLRDLQPGPKPKRPKPTPAQIVPVPAPEFHKPESKSHKPESESHKPETESHKPAPKSHKPERTQSTDTLPAQSPTQNPRSTVPTEIPPHKTTPTTEPSQPPSSDLLHKSSSKINLDDSNSTPKLPVSSDPHKAPRVSKPPCNKQKSQEPVPPRRPIVCHPGETPRRSDAPESKSPPHA